MLRVTCEHPDAHLPSAICQMWRELTAHKASPYQYATQHQLEVGWVRLARAVRLAPTMSGDLSRSNARGRSDLHSPNDAWTSLTHGMPGIRQARRGMNAASSPFRQNGDSRLAATGSSGFREQIDGLGWSRANLCIDTRDPRDEASAGRAGLPAGPDIPPGERRWDSEANAEAAGRRERSALMSGYRTVDPSSWHVWSAIGRPTPRPWKRWML